jgi:hypothetical protein
MGLGREKKINWMNVNNLLIQGDLTSEVLRRINEKSFSPSNFDARYMPSIKCHCFDDNEDGCCDCCGNEME